MLYITKKILCTTAITAILNLSFHPAHAVKIKELDDATNHSTSRLLMKEDPSAETLQTSVPTTQSWMPELVKEAGSYSFSALKGLAQLPRLASKGIIYAVQHPMEALTLGLATQVTTAGALKNKKAIGDEFGIDGLIGIVGQPSVASLTNDNVFVAWIDIQDGNSNLYGRIFSQNGIPVDNEFQINQVSTTSIPDISASSIASLTNENVFVAWCNSGIYGRIFSAKGPSLDNDFMINQDVSSDQGYLSVASLTNGNVFATFVGNQTGSFNIYGQILSPNGTVITNEFTINQPTTSPQYNPFVASLTNENVFVAWESGQSWAWSIYGRLFSAKGNPLGNEFTISQGTTPQHRPSIASLTNGNVFVAWMNDKIGNYEIYGRVLAPNGTAINDEFLINKLTTNTQGYPSVTTLNNGNAFIAWMGYLTGKSFDIYGRILSATGIPQVEEFQINQNTTGNQMNPSVTSLTSENVFITWIGNQDGNYGVYGRIFSTNGVPLGNEFIISASSEKLTN